MLFSGEPSVKKRKLFVTSLVTLLLLGTSLAGYIFIGYFLSREDFTLFILGYSLLFLCYIYFLRYGRSPLILYQLSSAVELRPELTASVLNQKSNLNFFLIAALLFRLIFLFSIPSLSDDYFRFIWDGTIWINGENPFAVIPSVRILNGADHNSYLMKLYEGMNSPNYFTVYPPVCQFIFALAVKLYPANLLGSVVVLRLMCIAAEAGTIYLLIKILSHLNLSKRNVLLYALNPLVIIELSGNIHFEAVMIFFMVLAVHLLIQSEKKLKSATQELNYSKKILQPEFIYSAIAFALAIASKLIPLIFLPFLIRRLKWRRSIIYFSIVAITLFILFLPFLNATLISKLSSSLNLYFQKFEFNASIFYLIRQIGLEWKGYDVIQTAGPWLASITFLFIMFLSWLEKTLTWKQFFLTMQWAITIYLLLATTVHPWYLTTLVMLSPITGYWYPVVWSLFIALTYAAYQTTPYQEQLWLVTLEYTAVVAVLFFEIYTRTKTHQHRLTI
ncbi:MAG: hypothetical protein H0V65_00690 [Chitinophagales bacterium]|nr:hypothetical protein [Chitinophagales bacterium]